MSILNLEHDNYYRKRVGYFVFARAKDHVESDCEAIIDKDPTASGCNPYRWTLRKHVNSRGYEFPSRDEALKQAKFAAGAYGTYELSMVDKDSVDVIAVEFVQTQTANTIGV